MIKPILSVTNLNVSLSGNTIHKGLSFDVKRGENLTILGPNGVGKTVLLRSILGLIPSKGKIVWEDDVRLGYLPQGLNQLQLQNLPLTVLDFLKLNRHNLNENSLKKVIANVGLSWELIYHRANTLSGGQFQRLLIAWVLLDNPNVIILDEPTTSLDIGGGETIYSLIHSLQKKTKLTVILVTHDIQIVSKYSTHVLCLSRFGKICYGTPETIRDPKTLKKIYGMGIKFYRHNQKNKGSIK